MHLISRPLQYKHQFTDLNYSHYSTSVSPRFVMCSVVLAPQGLRGQAQRCHTQLRVHYAHVVDIPAMARSAAMNNLSQPAAMTGPSRRVGVRASALNNNAISTICRNDRYVIVMSQEKHEPPLTNLV